MAENEQDLTFRRCPSCNNLLHALATTCKMCGYSFAAGGDKGSSDKGEKKLVDKPIETDKKPEFPKADFPKPQTTPPATASDKPEAQQGSNDTTFPDSSRVRQKTVSLTGDQVKDFLSQKQTPVAKPVVNQGVQQATPSSPISVKQEPDEMQKQDEKQESKESIVKAPEKSGESKPIFKPEPIAASLFNQPHARPQVNPQNIQTGSPVQVSQPVQGQPVPSHTPPRPAQPMPGQSVQTPAFQGKPTVPQPQQQGGQQQGEGAQAAIRQQASAEVLAQIMKETSSENKAINTNNSNTNLQESSFNKGVTMKDEVEKTKLLGWFINYNNNPLGWTVELRAGRAFIGKQRLRPNDIIIDSDKISTPHCLVQINEDQGLLIQDLMSDHGTKVKKVGQKDFTAIATVTKLDHGDTVVLGDLEVKVCLVPQDKS